MTGAVWRPTFIDIEPEFNKFVPNFRNGKLVRDLVPDQPDMALNADYYFPDDHVIAELKCMETDSRDSYPQRVSEAFTHFGYSGSDLMGFLFRGEPMPDRVAARLRQKIANPLRQAMRKANKQIAATKRLLNDPDAFGLAIFANDKNLGLSPQGVLSILSEAALNLSTSHVDGFVYTTPNVYYDTGDDIARAVWIPLYKEGREALGDFVNPFGSAWIDFCERPDDPYLDRWTGDEYRPDILSARPVDTFGRKHVKKPR